MARVLTHCPANGVVLELSKAEAALLTDLLGRCSGSTEMTRNRHACDVFTALYGAKVRDQIGTDFVCADNVIRFRAPGADQ